MSSRCLPFGVNGLRSNSVSSAQSLAWTSWISQGIIPFRNHLLIFFCFSENNSGDLARHLAYNQTHNGVRWREKQKPYKQLGENDGQIHHQSEWT